MPFSFLVSMTISPLAAALLLLNQGRPVSQEELIEHVWDGSVDVFSNSIRVHISSLRKKLRAVLGYDPIINRIGEGYHLGGCDEN